MARARPPAAHGAAAGCVLGLGALLLGVRLCGLVLPGACTHRCGCHVHARLWDRVQALGSCAAARLAGLQGMPPPPCPPALVPCCRRLKQPLFAPAARARCGFWRRLQQHGSLVSCASVIAATSTLRVLLQAFCAQRRDRAFHRGCVAHQRSLCCDNWSCEGADHHGHARVAHLWHTFGGGMRTVAAGVAAPRCMQGLAHPGVNTSASGARQAPAAAPPPRCPPPPSAGMAWCARCAACSSHTARRPLSWRRRPQVGLTPPPPWQAHVAPMVRRADLLHTQRSAP